MLPHQSGLLVVELVARNNRVAYAAKDQPTVFLLHFESAVEVDLRDVPEYSEFLAVRGYLCTRSRRTLMHFGRVASTWMWRRKCGAQSGARRSKKAERTTKALPLRCPQIRIRFRILDFAASFLTNMSFQAPWTTTMALLPAHLLRPSLDQD